MQRFHIMKGLLAILAIPWLLTSCSESQFGVRRGQVADNTPDVKISSANQCSNFTLIRPKVDLLFLWDNSSSAYFINDETRKALNRLVNNVSNRFDYHIVMAPLIRANNWGVNDYMRIVTYDTAGLSSTALSMRVPKENASNFLSFPTAPGSTESGLERAREVLHHNIQQTNGVFRQGAYSIIVLMSTEDDNSFATGTNYINPALRTPYVNNKAHELLCIRGNYNNSYGSSYNGSIYNQNCAGAPTLNSPMMRFISVVANDVQRCQNNKILNAKVGESYERMSSLLYIHPYENSIPSPNDQFGAPLQQRGSVSYQRFDSNDICRRDYKGIFDGVNSAIQDTVISHVYKYWPVAGPNASIDPDTIIVRKSNGQEFFEIPGGVTIIEDYTGTNDRDLSNQPIEGWRYINNDTRNTRFLPSNGEPYTGHLVQLFGNAKVTYPECLKITFSSEQEYYGYVHITGKPLESSIVLAINGTTINRCASGSSTNCWELATTGGSETRNIKIQSPTNFTPANPPDTRTGWFLRLRGNAIYSNGANVNVNWLPSS